MGTNTKSNPALVELAKWHKPTDPFPTNVTAKLFGHLVQEAMPVLQNYHSDLYHDALWLDRNVTGETTFYYAVDDMGTSIGQERDLVFSYRKAVQLRVTVTNYDSVWYAQLAAY